MKASEVEINKEYNPYYDGFISSLEGTELISGLTENLSNNLKFLNSIPEDKYNYAYAEGKWTIKEIIQHLIDSERIFSYRALCFSRGETQNLPGFEQDDYVANVNLELKPKQAFIEEYESVRKASIALFSNLSDDALKVIGTASGSNMSVRAAGFLVIGHETHHFNVIRNKYL